jgi:ubiquinone/menaquinone biosynthesis C-methylase UbiE
MKNFFESDERSALESIELAQFIAFAPIVFQASRCLRNLGILQLADEAGAEGTTASEIESKTGLSPYGVRVLLEAGLGIGLLYLKDNRYRLTKTGWYILKDAMTTANIDWMHDINYRGMFDLEGSIKTGKPTGLATLGTWKTLYEGLSQFKPHEQKSWLAFDHFYSSDSFPIVLPHVFRNKPNRILDIGGNTGKFALKCFEYDPEVQVTLADLPGQLNMARKTIADAGHSARASFLEVDMLSEKSTFHEKYDLVWMSQFLDCFSESEIISIIKRCQDALAPGGRVMIMELFWDRQKFKVSSFCLQMTSLYFTNIANGNSQMYHSDLFSSLVEKAGFKVEQIIDNIGVSHSLMICNR